MSEQSKMIENLHEQGRRARKAAALMAMTGSLPRERGLGAIAKKLRERTDEVLAANKKDIDAAQENNLSAAMVDRLLLTESRIEGIATAVLEVAALPDPIGIIAGGGTRPNGMRVVKTKVPLGVIGMIYESRPNVTVDAASLCLKAGNACLLRGGKEAIHSNTALVLLMQEALAEFDLPRDAVQLVTDTTRDSATAMMKMNGLIDVLIPRGSIGLINTVVQQSTLPVIQTGAGNCHVFVDATANLAMAADIVFNAKTNRPSTCNAAETLLVHKDIAKVFLPMAKHLLDQKNVELRGCPETCAILGDNVQPVTDEDYATEFLDYILAVRVVDSVEQAVEHIAFYTTNHSESIVTESYSNAEYFTMHIDAAAVYVNVSTRFTDGGEFGEGAEIGISNQKLHARGPLGLRQLTTDKYIVYGNGQLR